MLGGWAAVQEGEAVTAGDLLISGVRESEVDEKIIIPMRMAACLQRLKMKFLSI